MLLESPPAGSSTRMAVQLGLLGIILVSTVALIVETMPAISGRVPQVFLWIEVLTIAIFTVEYALRVWSSAEAPAYSDGLRGRLRYMRSPYAVIDLLAIVPFYLSAIPMDLRFLRMVRLLRLVRLAKLARYSDAMALLARVIVARRYELGVTMFVGLIMLVMAAVMMYMAEHEAQPEDFSSIPATMWWAVTTLTTVGYGDLTPITTAGRLIGAVIAVLGIGMFALPTGILGASFVDEVRKRNELAALGSRCPTCGQPVASHSSGEQ